MLLASSFAPGWNRKAKRRRPPRGASQIGRQAVSGKVPFYLLLASRNRAFLAQVEVSSSPAARSNSARSAPVTRIRSTVSIRSSGGFGGLPRFVFFSFMLDYCNHKKISCNPLQLNIFVVTINSVG